MFSFKSSAMAAALTIAAALGFGNPSQAATVVDTELSLLVDVSTSVGYTSFQLQRQGYVDAFRDSAIQSAILDTDGGNRLGKIAVEVVYWASLQVQAVQWTLLDSVAAINSFADAIAAAERPNPYVPPYGAGSETAIGSAINYAVNSVNSNDYDGTKRIIDISGDGRKNFGDDLNAARQNALASGIDRINGVAIEPYVPAPEGSLTDYYRQNVIAGTDSFALTALNFQVFGEAIKTKLDYEIRDGSPNGKPPVNPAAVPLPAGGLLLLSGLGAAAALRRKKRG